MGLFNLFKKSTILQDDFFGALRFVDFKDASKNYFEGKGHFKPTDSNTEYLIQADKDGPTDNQKQFYVDLQSDFTKYIQKIKPLMRMSFVIGKKILKSKTLIRSLNLCVSQFQDLTINL